MIIDNLKCSSKYEHINPLFKKAFEYLKSLDFSKLETGKTELYETDLVVIISDNDLKTKEEAKLEVHNKYIDIQLPISDTETFGWAHRGELQNATAPFGTEKDIQFFEDEIHVFFNLCPGNFVIFFPEDAHAPCVGEGTNRKIIIKVKAY